MLQFAECDSCPGRHLVNLSLKSWPSNVIADHRQDKTKSEMRNKVKWEENADFEVWNAPSENKTSANI